MNIISRIANSFKKKSITYYPTLNVNSFDSSMDGFENYMDAHNLNYFKNSLYLYIGVSMIRETVSSLDWNLYKIINKQGDVEEIFDDPLIDLFYRPNSEQTKKEFLKIAVAHYILTGETFWYYGKDDNNKEHLLILRPDRVEIVLSENKRKIIGYKFQQTDTTTLYLQPEEVLHIKDPDPTNEIRGVGVIRPATRSILTQQEISKYQEEAFRSKGKPDIHVIVEDDLTQEMIDDGRERWHKNMQNQKGSRIAFFGGKTKEVVVQPNSPKEMDFLASEERKNEDILFALRIPKQMLNADVNYANSQVALGIYFRNACAPIIDSLLDVVNNKFLIDRKLDENKFFTYESPVKEDRELLLKETTELYTAGITKLNEARDMQGLVPDDENGEEYKQSGSVFELSMKKELKKKAKSILKNRTILRKKFEVVEAMVEVEKEKNAPKRYMNSVFNTKESKEGYIKAFNTKIDKKANVFHDNLVAYNVGLEKRIMKQMEDFGINPQRIFDASFEIGEAKKVFIPIMTNMFSKVGQDSMDSIATGFQKASESFFTPSELIRSLERRAEFFIISMLDTDFKQLQGILIAGLEDGKGVDQMGRDIRKYFEDMSVSRARTIARTETGRLVSQATEESYRQSEFVTGKEWLTAEDSSVRDKEGTVNDHQINHGKIVAIGNAFPNGEQYPGEKTINCRCAIAPTV